jgi:hypothetical protein
MARYLVQYPTGNQFLVEGEYRLVNVDGFGHVPFVFTGPGRAPAIGLDPRGLVTEAPGTPQARCVYNPRQNRRLPEPVPGWMAEHPEWPAVLTEQVKEERHER